MARPRSGSLELRPNGYHARITIDLPGGGVERRWVHLETFDRTRAKRIKAKLVREIAAGRVVADAKESVQAPDTLEQVARDWCAARMARGVAMAATELGYFEHHVFDAIGAIPLHGVTKAHLKSLLDSAAIYVSPKTKMTLAKETVAHLRRLLVRLFNELEASEVVTSNPMRGVKLPKAREDKRPRTMLTDAEYSALLAADVDFTPAKKTGKTKTPEVEFFEMKVVAFTARTLGGARAAECLRWDWSMIDREEFVGCKLARAKGGDIQELEFPEVLRPFLHGWWQASGCPEYGPVFPVTRGTRKGELRGKSNLAGRFRRALLRAGVTRNEVHNDTPFGRRTDFHTLRRAYVSGLANSGMNEQSAMTLAHHHDSDVHRRYNLARVIAVPNAALPQINGDFARVLARPVDDSTDPAPQVLDIRAGHGIRTRDIQLGKHAVNTPSSDYVKPSSILTPPSAVGEVPCFAERREVLAPVGKTNRGPATAFEGDEAVPKSSVSFGARESDNARTLLLCELDAAARRGDVDAAADILARLMCVSADDVSECKGVRS